MSDKFKVLEFSSPDEAKAALEQIKRDMPMMLEHTALIAQLRRASYQAHLAEGFTPDEALTLCVTLTI